MDKSIQVSQKELLKAINLASFGLKNSSLSTNTSGLHIIFDSGGMRIEASDIVAGISIPIPAKMVGEGDFWINPTLFSEYVATLKSGDIYIKLNSSEKILIQSEGGVATIPAMAVENGTSLDKVPVGEVTNCKTSDFVNSLKWASTAVAIDESRPVLTGVLFRGKGESVRVVGSDGYRLSLSVMSFEKDGELDFLVPYKPLSGFMKEWQGMGEVVSIVNDREGGRIWIVGKDRTFYVRLIQGDFPDFTKILSSEAAYKIDIDAQGLYQSIKQVSLFARQSSNIALCDFEKNKATVRASGGGVGSVEAVVDVKYDEERLSLAFNYRYLLEYVKAVTGDNITILCNGPLTPVQFVDHSKKGFLHIIMPVRL